MKGYEECMGNGLLRKIPPSRQKAGESMKAAKNWIGEAEKNIQNQTFNSSVISSYLAMFHSARSILFKDGVREKSHFCIARYLEEKYAKPGSLEQKWIDLLDYYRDLRHERPIQHKFFH